MDAKQVFLRQTRRDVGGEVGGTFGRVGVRLGGRPPELLPILDHWSSVFGRYSLVVSGGPAR